jgi:hypothetical protein
MNTSMDIPQLSRVMLKTIIAVIFMNIEALSLLNLAPATTEDYLASR